MIAVAAASGAMAVAMPAHADSAVDGSAAGSPGLISGNTVQVPVHVPVNVCGNTVNVAGLLNPAAGNTCVNEAAGKGDGPSSSPGGGAVAHGSGTASGVISGNGVQIPVDLPVDISGNTVSGVGIGNAATGNESVNAPGDHPRTTPTRSVPRERHLGRETAPRQHRVAALASTGADHTLPAVAGSAALLLSGAVLYRRFRPGARA
ncbi:chaplin [Streptomyces sp. HUAS ZL42]|uniref:chaplin n=1 Tax=Streptomyces sp. HUAS ZL42 TaxID=3231715 RepID=UPI00345E6EEC